MAENYRVCFNTWINAKEDIHLKASKPADQLGKISIDHAFILTFFSFLTNRRQPGDNQCASCDGFHTGGCMKQMLQAKYQEMVANGQVAPRGNGNGRQNRNNGFRKQQNNNQYGQQQNYYPQQQQMMQQQPVQYTYCRLY